MTVNEGFLDAIGPMGATILTIAGFGVGLTVLRLVLCFGWRD